MRIGIFSARRDPGGTSFLEALVALALVGVLVLVTLPWLFASLHRARLHRTAQETAEMVELARLQARKLALRTHVVWDAASDRMVAFVDVDLDGRFDPDVDYPVGSPLGLPKSVELRGPDDAVPGGAGSQVGFERPSPGASRGAVFYADGSVMAPGAFRFADRRGNCLEVRIDDRLGSPVQIRKWSGGSDTEANWIAGGDPQQPWTWH